MDPLKRFQRFLNEEEMPFFNNFEKQILQYGLDNIGNLEPGLDIQEVGYELFNPADGVIIYHNEGIEFLSNFNDRDGGSGWAAALEFAFDAVDEMESTEFVAQLIQDGNWAGVANHIFLEKGRRLLLASEVLAQKIASGDEELSAEDIQDLEDELELFIAS